MEIYLLLQKDKNDMMIMEDFQWHLRKGQAQTKNNKNKFILQIFSHFLKNDFLFIFSLILIL